MGQPVSDYTVRASYVLFNRMPVYQAKCCAVTKITAYLVLSHLKNVFLDPLIVDICKYLFLPPKLPGSYWVVSRTIRHSIHVYVM